MKLTMATRDLAGALKDAKAVASRSKSAPWVLTTCRLAATAEGFVLIEATDLETHLRVRLDARVEQAGECRVSVARLLAIVASLGSEEVRLEMGSEGLSIRGGQAHLSIPSWSGDEGGLTHPAIETEGLSEIRLVDLQRLLGKVLYAVADGDDEKVPSVHVRLDGSSIFLAATDGHRLAVAELGLPGCFPGEGLVSKSCLSRIAKIKGEGIAAFRFAPNHVAIQVGRREYVTPLLAGAVPPAERFLASMSKVSFVAPPRSLAAALHRVASVIPEDLSPALQLSLSSDRLTATYASQTDHQISASEPIPVSYGGESMTFAANADYLADALLSMTGDCDMVRIEIDGGAIRIEQIGGRDRITVAVIAQVRLDAEKQEEMWPEGGEIASPAADSRLPASDGVERVTISVNGGKEIDVSDGNFSRAAPAIVDMLKGRSKSNQQPDHQP